MKRVVAEMRANLLVAAASLLVGVIAAEGVLRAFGAFEPLQYPPENRQPELYTHVEEFGYALWPSREMHYWYPPDAPRRIVVTSNAAGFRNAREFSARDDRLNILVVGDSYVFGEGVEEVERFTNRLEASSPDWRVDNMGIPGFGPDLMLLALEEVLKEVRPKVVLFCLFYDDFRRVRPRYAGLGFPIPRLRLVDGRLQKVPYAGAPLWRRTHLFALLQSNGLFEDQPFAALTDEEWALNSAILERYLESASVHDFVPILLYLPGPWKGERQRRVLRWTREFADDHRTHFLDLSPTIHGADGDSVYLPKNTHYGPYGHQLV